ncbi:MAG: hypothetical protein DWQ08_05945 [Proteobacteria bacterium]|nr:MAG: hypothetical protein DWQ08_05945 [Pseudomonadota bacterium]
MKHRAYRTDPFIDLLFNALLGFTMLFFIAIVFMNPDALKGRVNLKAEYIISVTWPEERRDDLDIWVEDPYGEIVSYLQKDAGWLHLDRDDQGDVNDTIDVDGRKVTYPINQEIVTIRGVIEGEYVVNLYYYEKRDRAPLEAVVRIDQVNPTLTTVFAEKVELSHRDEEVTVVRFTPNRSGGVTDVNRRPKILTPYSLDPST